MVITSFLAGAILGATITHLLMRDKIPNKMLLTFDIDTAKMANIFTAVSKSSITAFYLDFPGLDDDHFCRIYFTDTKKRMEKNFDEN